MQKELISEQHEDEPRVLSVGKHGSGIQIQIEQDGQDAYIDISISEARQLI